MSEATQRQTPSERRARRALALLLAGAVALAAGVGAVWRDARMGAVPEVSGPVLPGWAERSGEARMIEITGPDAVFMMERGDDGWSMPSRGGYPVRAERIAELDAALASLRFGQAMTRDPALFGRLGVDDPGQGGRGVRVTVLDALGDRLAELVAGDDREGGVYLRPAGAARAYAASGAMPRLDDPGRWLGLDFMNIDPARVAGAAVDPGSGPGYALEKPEPAARDFALAGPAGWRLITSGAANGVARAGARVRFRDVRPAADLTAPVIARHRGATHDGLVYAYVFRRQDGRIWAELDVRAADADTAGEARLIANASQGWVFEVSEDAFERMTRPLGAMAERARDID